jgi:hypothetical protein
MGPDDTVHARCPTPPSRASTTTSRHFPTTGRRLGKVSVDKRCVRFKKLDDLNLDVVAQLAQRAAALSKAGQFAM